MDYITSDLKSVDFKSDVAYNGVKVTSDLNITKKKEVSKMATKFVGYVPDVKEFADANGKTIKINRVRLNMVDDNARGCIGQDVQYYMVKKEDLQRVCGVKEFEELRQYIGYKAFISMTLDVRSQKPVLSEIGFMKGN